TKRPSVARCVHGYLDEWPADRDHRARVRRPDRPAVGPPLRWPAKDEPIVRAVGPDEVDRAGVADITRPECDPRPVRRPARPRDPILRRVLEDDPLLAIER